MFGPDMSSSLTIAELRHMVDSVRFVDRMRHSPVDKDSVAKEKEPLRRLFGKSAVATRDLSAGHVVREEDVAFRKPGTGIPESAFDQYVGRRLKRQVATGTFFDTGDFE
jgi:N-acetylneuraminate synthase